MVKIADVDDAIYSPIDNDGTRFWIQTTLDAPNGRVVEVDLAQPERAALEDHHS